MLKLKILFLNIKFRILKIKNKFIKSVFLLLILGILFQTASGSIFNSVDRNSYATLIKGIGMINGKTLVIDKRVEIKVGDLVKTIGKESLLVFDWGDGSITRLAGDSTIEVKDNYISKDLSLIKISFKLLQGKTWSNVINYMGEDSFFKESFRDVEAGVRGTVFDIDLEKDYLYVQNHEVSLKKENGENIVIPKDKPFSLKTFSFIEDIKEFLENVRDKAWEDLNKKYDLEFLNNIKLELSSSLEKNNPLIPFLEIFMPKYRVLYEINSGKDFEKIKGIISNLSEDDKKELYKKVLYKYQKINFASSNDADLFKEKIFLKRILLLLASEQDKKGLIKNTTFDFQDIVNNKNALYFDDTLKIFTENKDLVKSMGIKLDDLVSLDYIPKELKDSFTKNLDVFKDIFGNNLDVGKLKDFLQNFDLNQNMNNIKEKAIDTLNNIFK